MNLHHDVAFYVLEQEQDISEKFEKGHGFNSDLHDDDPLMRLDEFRLVRKEQRRNATQLYHVA